LTDPSTAAVWTVELTASAQFDPGDWCLLAPDERRRANRLVREEDRARWVQARASLRRVLARYLSVEPSEIVFGPREFGKPELIGPKGLDLRFNASRSGRVAVIAVAVEREVGIDVERIQPDFAWETVARAFLSAAELASLQRTPGEQQCQAFFDCWVRKEAYLKGLGVGLSPSSRDFSLPFGGQPAEVTDPAHSKPAPGRRWHLEALDISGGYAAAVATEGACRIVKLRL
jgi:4'-phosphopantetheinyl transferase